MRFDKIITEEMTHWYLEAVETNNEWMVAIEAVPFIIGRDEDCHLKLTSKWISRHHAEIHKSGDHLWIRDLGSTNGTFVNNKQILQAELLEPGDTIALGKSKFNLKKVLSTANSIAEATFSMDFAENRNLSAALEPEVARLAQRAQCDSAFSADLQAREYEPGRIRNSRRTDKSAKVPAAGAHSRRTRTSRTRAPATQSRLRLVSSDANSGSVSRLNGRTTATPRVLRPWTDGGGQSCSSCAPVQPRIRRGAVPGTTCGDPP